MGEVEPLGDKIRWQFLSGPRGAILLRNPWGTKSAGNQHRRSPNRRGTETAGVQSVGGPNQRETKSLGGQTHGMLNFSLGAQICVDGGRRGSNGSRITA